MKNTPNTRQTHGVSLWLFLLQLVGAVPLAVGLAGYCAGPEIVRVFEGVVEPDSVDWSTVISLLLIGLGPLALVVFNFGKTICVVEVDAVAIRCRTFFGKTEILWTDVLFLKVVRDHLKIASSSNEINISFLHLARSSELVDFCLAHVEDSYVSNNEANG